MGSPEKNGGAYSHESSNKRLTAIRYAQHQHLRGKTSQEIRQMFIDDLQPTLDFEKLGAKEDVELLDDEE